jgi:hypothetical protein
MYRLPSRCINVELLLTVFSLVTPPRRHSTARLELAVHSLNTRARLSTSCRWPMEVCTAMLSAGEEPRVEKLIPKAGESQIDEAGLPAFGGRWGRIINRFSSLTWR